MLLLDSFLQKPLLLILKFQKNHRRELFGTHDFFWTHEFFSWTHEQPTEIFSGPMRTFFLDPRTTHEIFFDTHEFFC